MSRKALKTEARSPNTDFLNKKRRLSSGSVVEINYDDSNDFCAETLANIGIENVLEIVKEIRNENLALKEEIRQLRYENDQAQKRLLTEILSIKSQFCRNPKKKIRLIMPLEQFATFESFEEFDEKIKKSEGTAHALEEELCQITIPKPSKYVREVWRRLITDEIASTYCWRGTVDKQPVRSLAFTSVLRGAFMRRFALGDRQFDDACIKWFQTAKERLKKSNKSDDVKFFQYT